MGKNEGLRNKEADLYKLFNARTHHREELHDLLSSVEGRKTAIFDINKEIEALKDEIRAEYPDYEFPDEI